MSYWIYQHIGNLSPTELAEDEMWAKVTAAEGDVAPMLREFAEKADRENRGSRWSYCRDLGRTRLVVMDSRAGRILEDDCRRMVDDEEWRYIEESTSGDFDHVLLATSLPIFLGRGMHHLEAWNEAICDGAWGSLAARLGEKLRQGLDLEHWAAFEHSFGQVTGLMREVGAGKRGKAPATIVALSGDVHHAYLADVAFRREAGVQSAVYQAVCSPIRNPLDSRERQVIRAGISRPAEIVGRTLARAAGVSDPNVRWRFSEGPWFDNQVASLDIDGRSAVMKLEKTVSGDGQHPELELVLERSLT